MEGQLEKCHHNLQLLESGVNAFALSFKQLGLFTGTTVSNVVFQRI